jgi:hypothetical protein
MEQAEAYASTLAQWITIGRAVLIFDIAGNEFRLV